MKSTIGIGVSRIDGPLKTTGLAMYTADYHFPGMVHAVPVQASIAAGRIRKIDASVAEKMPGVVAVLHHGNIGTIYRSAPHDEDATNSEMRPPFEDETVYYWGQYVAVVVAETLEEATAAAAAVRVEFDVAPFNVNLDLSKYEGTRKSISKRGTPDAAFSTAPVTVDATYTIAVETQNPIEMHASVAVWEGDRVTLYETSQGVVNHRAVLAQMLGMPVENVRVITRFLGSGFGSKLFPWPHSAMTAMAARRLNRPVKLSLNRRMMFSNVGHRPQIEQRVRLGATPDGRLVSLHQDYWNHTSMIDRFEESCGEATPYLYSTPNLEVTGAVVPRNTGTPMYMRGPGAVPGLYATESAMNELAEKLNIDPVKLRLLNEPAKDESTGQNFSSRHLKECYEVGAQKFGWERYKPEIGSMRRGEKILGWGVAGASWMAMRLPCQVHVALTMDGRVSARCATQDIGTGTYTVFAQILHEKTGIPMERIDVVLGDTWLPEGPMSGGSLATSSFVSAVADGADNVVKQMLVLAVESDGSRFAGEDATRLTMSDGRVHEATDEAMSGVPFEEILKLSKLNTLSAVGRNDVSFSDPKAKDLSIHSYGAQFVEVEWEPEIARMRVSRVVTVIDGGRIMNPKAAKNQIIGSVVMGVGMGLLEETVYDHRTGQPINNSMADYLVAVNADTPEIDVTFLDYPDPVINVYGARGIGEIGLAGVAPAITAAIYHATGIRMRSLPVRIEDLMESKVGVA